MKIDVAKRLEGIGEYYFSQKLREIDTLNTSGEKVINLGIGSPDLAPDGGVIKTLQEESMKPAAHGYQNYKGIPPFREAMAAWYKRKYGVLLDATTEILPLMGSKEGVMHVCMTYLNQGDEVLVPNPGYPTYRSAVTLAGGVVKEYMLQEENDWFPDFEALEKDDLSNVKLMWVNYPHMPTGGAPTKKLFEQLVAFGKKHQILICHDNPYSFILTENPMSLLAVDGAKEVVIELNSLSKSHNMAGWRIGMLCGARERIEEVLRFKSNMDSGMFLPLQWAAATALTLGDKWISDLNVVYAKRREKVFRLLDLLNCTYGANQVGLFVWARIPAGYETSYELSDAVLNSAKVFITPGGIFGSAGNNYVRVSLCSSEDLIDEAIYRIEKSSDKNHPL